MSHAAHVLPALVTARLHRGECRRMKLGIPLTGRLGDADAKAKHEIDMAKRARDKAAVPSVATKIGNFFRSIFRK